MLDQVQKVLDKDCALNNKTPIIIGVSGGADSLAMLDVLRTDYQVVVTHFNHLLRTEASNDARFVEGIATKLDIPFVVGKGATFDFARENGLSVEEAARELRYRFLFKQADKYNAQAVAVAHNADDQVETVLMHLLRGAGLDGLTGMPYRSLPNPWSKKIALVRPFLAVPRREIEAYCAKQNLKPIHDYTNQDNSFFRNRIRHELIPKLETYVPGVRSRLLQTAQLLAADRQVLDKLTENIEREIIQELGTGYVCIDHPGFKNLPLGLQRRMVRKAISYLHPGPRDVDFAMVQRVLEFSNKPSRSGLADLGLGLRATIEGDNLFLSHRQFTLPKEDWPQITGQKTLSIPGELKLGERWILIAEIVVESELAKVTARKNLDPYQAWIDLEGQEPYLNIRPRCPGDRLRPLGMTGKSMKISDIMINQKIPKRARADWPLVCNGDQIVWVPGFRLGHSFRLKSTSKQIVKLRLRFE